MITILPTISTTCIALSAIFVALGWYYIRTGNRIAHQRWMTAGAIFATLFFIIYVSRTLFVGNTHFGGPENLKIYYQSFLFFHITLATIIKAAISRIP